MEEELIMIACPLCGLSRVVDQPGSRAKQQKRFKHPKGRIRFDRVDPEEGVFVDIREAPGGKKPGTGAGYPGSAEGRGFHRIRSHSLKETIEDKLLYDEYQDLIDQLKEQIRKIEKVLF